MASTEPANEIQRAPTNPVAAAPDAAEPPQKPMITSDVGDIVQSQGVTRMEAVYREAQSNKSTFWLVGASVLVCAWAYSNSASLSAKTTVRTSPRDATLTT